MLHMVWLLSNTIRSQKFWVTLNHYSLSEYKLSTKKFQLLIFIQIWPQIQLDKRLSSSFRKTTRLRLFKTQWHIVYHLRVETVEWCPKCHQWCHICHICDIDVVYDFSLTGVPCSDDIGQNLFLFGLFVSLKIRRKFRIPKII